MSENETKWLKSPVSNSAPELIESMQTQNELSKEYAVAEYDKLIDVPKSIDESILMGTYTGSGTGSGTGSAHSAEDYPVNINANYIMKTWKSNIESGPNLMATAINNAVSAIVAVLYVGYDNATEKKKATQIITGQIYRLIALFCSFLIIWNWWYLWNYTTFTFNFEQLLDYPPFSILFYIFEPSFKVIELMNYYLISRRMDAELSSSSRSFMRKMWDYRPI